MTTFEVAQSQWGSSRSAHLDLNGDVQHLNIKLLGQDLLIDVFLVAPLE